MNNSCGKIASASEFAGQMWKQWGLSCRVQCLRCIYIALAHHFNQWLGGVDSSFSMSFCFCSASLIQEQEINAQNDHGACSKHQQLISLPSSVRLFRMQGPVDVTCHVSSGPPVAGSEDKVLTRVQLIWCQRLSCISTFPKQAYFATIDEFIFPWRYLRG